MVKPSTLQRAKLLLVNDGFIELVMWLSFGAVLILDLLIFRYLIMAAVAWGLLTGFWASFTYNNPLKISSKLKNMTGYLKYLFVFFSIMILIFTVAYENFFRAIQLYLPFICFWVSKQVSLIPILEYKLKKYKQNNLKEDEEEEN